MSKSNIILEYLQQIGAKKETDMYLKVFKGVEPSRFSIIVIDAATLAVYERDVASAIAYISSLGLTPVVLHDATGALGKQLVSDILRNGGNCQAIMTGLYSNEEAAKNIAAKARELSEAKTTAIMETEDVDFLLKQLLTLIKPRKLIFLNRFGGIRTKKDELLSYINLPNEYENISGVAADEYKPLLKTASEILAAADWKLHVEIVPPNGLLTELFTIKGSGTFAKKGPEIIKFDSSKADIAKINKVLEESFGKKLGGSYVNNGKDYFFFVEKHYNGVAAVIKVKDTYYIDKLAVLPEVQGEGLARDLITSVMGSCHKVFWRANSENHINEWYFRLCSGMQKISSWYVYWSNLDSDEIKHAVEYASKKPVDFVN